MSTRAWVSIIIILVVLAGVALRGSMTHFECPKCGTHFQVSPLRYLFASHSLGTRRVTCPSCGTIDFMKSISGRT